MQLSSTKGSHCCVSMATVVPRTSLSGWNCIASNGRMVLSDELARMWKEAGVRAEIWTVNLPRNSLVRLLVVCRSVSRLLHRHVVHDSGVLAKLAVRSGKVRCECEVSRAMTLSQGQVKRHRGVKLLKLPTRKLRMTCTTCELCDSVGMHRSVQHISSHGWSVYRLFSVYSLYQIITIAAWEKRRFNLIATFGATGFTLCPK